MHSQAKTESFKLQQKLVTTIIRLKNDLLRLANNPKLKEEFNTLLIRMKREINRSTKQVDYNKYQNEANQLILKFTSKPNQITSFSEVII